MKNFSWIYSDFKLLHLLSRRKVQMDSPMKESAWTTCAVLAALSAVISIIFMKSIKKSSHLSLKCSGR